MTEILLLEIYANIAINFHGNSCDIVAVAFPTVFYEMSYSLLFRSRCHGLCLSVLNKETTYLLTYLLTYLQGASIRDHATYVVRGA